MKLQRMFNQLVKFKLTNFEFHNYFYDVNVIIAVIINIIDVNKTRSHLQPYPGVQNGRA